MRAEKGGESLRLLPNTRLFFFLSFFSGSSFPPLSPHLVPQAILSLASLIDASSTRLMNPQLSHLFDSVLLFVLTRFIHICDYKKESDEMSSFAFECCCCCNPKNRKEFEIYEDAHTPLQASFHKLRDKFLRNSGHYTHLSLL